jgi:acetyl-CoA acyltransferase
MRPVYFAAARRTPIGRLRGALSGVRADDLAAHALSGVLADLPGLDPGRIDDVYWGAANQAGEDNRNVARMAVLLAGLPESVPGATLNRLCASGLEAVTTAARAVAAGEADVVVAGGAEACIHSITMAGFAQARTMSTRNDEPTKASRPFDVRRDGFVLGEGAGIMVLERE